MNTNSNRNWDRNLSMNTNTKTSVEVPFCDTPSFSARTADRTVSAHNLSSRKCQSNVNDYLDPVESIVRTTPGQTTRECNEKGEVSAHHHQQQQQLAPGLQFPNDRESDEDEEDEKEKSAYPEESPSRRGRTTRPSKYKETDIKRLESSRRTSRSRSQDRTRKLIASEDPARRRSRSRDTQSSQFSSQNPVKRRSRSQDPLLSAKSRLEERNRSKSQEPNEKARSTRKRQGRRPSRPSKRLDSTLSSTSTHSSPLPQLSSTHMEPKLNTHFEDEEVRTFDSILGLEPTLHANRIERSHDMLSLASPQPSKKVFEPTKNPHVSPTLFFNSMAKKVAGDRWLQDESIRSRRTTDSSSSPGKSLGDQLLALGKDSFNANTLDPDEKSMHSQDLTPQAPRRRGSKRLAGQKPKPSEPPLSSSEASITVTKSPQKQIIKIASKLVKTSKNMLNTENSGHKTTTANSVDHSSPSSFEEVADVKNELGNDSTPSSASSWVVHEDGALTPKTLKRKSTLQKAKNKMTTLLKSNKKSDPKMPDIWGALDDNESVDCDLANEESATSHTPPTSASTSMRVIKQFEHDGATMQVNPPPPILQEDPTPSPSRKIKSKAATQTASEKVVLSSDTERHTLRKSNTRKSTRSSSPTKRARSTSPSKSMSSSARQTSRSNHERRDLHTSSSRLRCKSLSRHKESNTASESTATLDKRRRSRSESRPGEEAESRSTGRDCSAPSDDISRSDSKSSKASSSTPSSRSKSPHSLRLATTSTKDRRPRHTSNSPGQYRGDLTKRREAMLKIRSARSLRSLNLLDESNDSKVNTSIQLVPSARSNKISRRHDTKEQRNNSGRCTKSEEVGQNVLPKSVTNSLELASNSEDAKNADLEKKAKRTKKREKELRKSSENHTKEIVSSFRDNVKL